MSSHELRSSAAITRSRAAAHHHRSATAMTDGDPISADARRFVAALLRSPKLLAAYGRAAKDANDHGDPGRLTAFLEHAGYHTTPTAISTAYDAAAQSTLGFWTGSYATTLSSARRSVTGPTLVITPKGTATLTGSGVGTGRLERVGFDHGVLQWSIRDNATSGRIQFSRPSDGGSPTFTGQLTLNASFRFQGRVAATPPSASTSTDRSTVQTVMQYLGDIVIIHAAASMAWQGIEWAGSKLGGGREADAVEQASERASEISPETPTDNAEAAETEAATTEAAEAGQAGAQVAETTGEEGAAALGETASGGLLDGLVSLLPDALLL